MIKLSLLPVAIKAFYGCQSHVTISLPCLPGPSRNSSSFLDAKSHILINLFSEHVTNFLSDGENDMSLTGSI